MRMFASDRVSAIMERLKWPEGEPIEAKMVTKAVENAQKQIEELNYERRKNVLKYDEVMNGQREVIYAERRKILEGQIAQGAGAGLRRGGRAGDASTSGRPPTPTPTTGTVPACSPRWASSSPCRAPRRTSPASPSSTSSGSASSPRRSPPTRRRRPRSAPT